MSSKRRIMIALILCLGVIGIGTAVYILIEDYTLLEGIYMSVITMATVGFGEVKPLSEAGRGFTIFFILIGFGSLAFAGHALGESLLEKVWSGRSEMKKMKKQISHLKSHYIICGVGRVGAAAAQYFREADADFVIIEANPDQCREIGEKGYLYIEGDATHETVLLEAGIKSAGGLLALLNSDPDNLFIVLTARELNPTLRIISRADEATSKKRILRAGADSVVSPFATAGEQIAGDMLVASGKAQPTDYSPQPRLVPQWVTVQDGSSMLGETIRVVSDQMGREVIGLRRNSRDLIFPEPEMKLETADMLLVIDEDLNSEDKSAQRPPPEPRKVVIVDDNPVILKLYTRLFQKAGFYPLAAADGHEGLDLILQEKPVAGVIDFMLPVLSGIEVCRQVRATEACKGIKLILFTADDQPETRKRALEAGADEVVVKSPEASEVIETVIRILEKNQALDKD